ncbi:thioredoxin [Bacteroidetes bacterium UKL13-3]|jgi:Fe-S cluster biogenesis protein NfuA|nr:thioredoxin [Bacteroidetes bacterium UKL13-3]HCP94682.1 NifU family protein [Bacteroidota bacterium]
MTEVKEFLEVYAEQTPNPETMKFVFNRMILPDDSADFPTRESAAPSPLAKNLYEFNFVNGVFIMNNFVTVTRSEGAAWDEIIPIMREFLKSYVEAKEPILLKSKKTVIGDYGADNVTVAKIIDVLDTYVKPAVEVDGGMISFKSYENGVVTVEMKGSCSGCPSSTVTLKRGIEGMLQRMVPEVREVIAEAL